MGDSGAARSRRAAEKTAPEAADPGREPSSCREAQCADARARGPATPTAASNCASMRPPAQSSGAQAPQPAQQIGVARRSVCTKLRGARVKKRASERERDGKREESEEKVVALLLLESGGVCRRRTRREQGARADLVERSHDRHERRGKISDERCSNQQPRARDCNLLVSFAMKTFADHD
eukprot:4271680-Prymnesium_polylepis.1